MPVWTAAPTPPSRTAPPTITVTQPGLPAHGALVEQDGVLARWFDRHGCIGAIVRPDHYVFGALTSTNAATLLKEWRDRPGTTQAAVP